MTDARSGIDADSWAFALATYAKPGVADACLTLQNEAGVDVMMMLIVVFAAVRRRIVLTRDEIAALELACRPWREQIVRPLRTIRTALKAGPKPAPSDATEQFRSSIKAAELAAEKLQNQLLAAHLPLKSAAKDAVTEEQLRAIVGYLVELFAEGRGERLALSTPIEVIAKAAMQDAC